jgi:hypothetical protein
MRGIWCGILAGTLLLSGCGRAYVPVTAKVAQGMRVRDAENTYARQFYEQLAPQYKQAVSLAGAVVTLQGDPAAAEAGVTTYDFSTTGTTGQVHVHTVVFDTTVAFADLMESFLADGDGPEVLPALLIPIAVQMTAAAAEALALYWLDHRGAAFQRDDAVKAMVLAMGVSLVPFMAEVRYLGHLAPVAAKILAVAPAFDAVSIAKAAVPMLGEVVLALRAIWKERKAAKAG